MRKLSMAFTIAVLIIPAFVFAQDNRAQALREVLNTKLSLTVETPQAKSTESQVKSTELPAPLAALQAMSSKPKALSNEALPEQATITYHYWTTWNYQATTGMWWTGLVIRNDLSFNYIRVNLYDSYGILRGQGTWSMDAWSQGAYVLDDWITSGYVPTIGYIDVFGSSYFETVLFVGSNAGGFGFFEKVPVYY